MRPTNETIKRLAVISPLIVKQMDNILLDWTSDWEQDKALMLDCPQHIIDMMFSAYVAGMLNVMSPKSNFNTKYQA